MVLPSDDAAPWSVVTDEVEEEATDVELEYADDAEEPARSPRLPVGLEDELLAVPPPPLLEEEEEEDDDVEDEDEDEDVLPYPPPGRTI